MLTALSLEHFKSWRRIQEMRLAAITGLFGSNSSGKTSILQVLLMLKQTVESPDRAQVLNLGDERSLTQLGTFRDMVYRHETPGTLRWTLSWSLPKELKVADPEQRDATLFSGKEMQFHAEITENASGRMVVKKLGYNFAGHDFVMVRTSEAAEKYQLSVEPAGFRFKRRTPGRAWDLPAPVKSYGFPDQVRTYHQNAGFLADFELAFEELFSRTYYLGPLRDYPQREYTWAGAQPADMGWGGERAIDAILASRERGEKISRGHGRKRVTVEEYVVEWLQNLGLIHSFSVRPITKGGTLYQVRVRKTPDAAEVLITDVGFGVSQILPVLVLCYYVPEGSIIILEQPEIHLHPSVQTGLADVFIDAIKTRKVQIILESHSEYLLRRLQRRIAEETLVKEDAALYFCDIADGASRLTPLELDVFGNITNWPKDFFGDEFGEMAATGMRVFVVDTNVAVVANGRTEQASPACMQACLDALKHISERGVVVLDDAMYILKEYMANLSLSGQPGLGDAFLKWVWIHQANTARCERVHITPRPGEENNFEDFPADPELAAFDPSDRKFVAAARASRHKPPILNAVDSDWWIFRTPLKKYRVRVRFLCPEHMRVRK